MLDQFINQYSVSKTLRFELIPTEKTKEHIARKGIIGADTELADSYKEMKKTIDEFHKWFIDEALSDAKLTGLEDFYAVYTAKTTDKDKDAFKTIKDALRKEIVSYFKKHDIYKTLDKKELIQKELEKWIDENHPGLYYDKNFCNFTTYFTGYNENRMNMYSDEEKATAVSHRLIDENLPKFIDNIRIFSAVKSAVGEIGMAAICADAGLESDVSALDDVFALEYYNRVLTQQGIGEYNDLIGKLNIGINLFNQQHAEHKLPKMKILFKQILSDRGSISWLPAAFESADVLLDNVCAFYLDYSENVAGVLHQALNDLPQADLNRIYVRNDVSITDISNRLFGYYGVLKDALGIDPESGAGKKEYYSVDEIQTALDEYVKKSDWETSPELFAAYSDNCIASCFAGGIGSIDGKIAETYGAVEELLNAGRSSDYRLSKADVQSLKAFLDSMMDLLHFVKPLHLKPDAELPKDDMFYGTFTPAFEQLQMLTKLYDMVRNFVTKKPYSTEKVKLTFDTNNGHLLGGWTDSKTDKSDNGTQYGGYLFRKKNCIGEYDYFLGISANKKLFRPFNVVATDKRSEYERLEYYQVKGQTIFGSSYEGSYEDDKTALLTAMVGFSEKSGNALLKEKINKYCYGTSNPPTPSGCMKIYREYPDCYERLLCDETFVACNNTLITNLRNTLKAMTRAPKAQKIAEKEYLIFSDMMEDAQKLNGEVIFHYFPINKDELDIALNDDNKPLYLFKISNKDLSFAEKSSKGLRKSHGKDNLHTMFFKALMSGEQSTYDIGTAEVFYREASIHSQNITVHDANCPIKKKNPNANGKSSEFTYDIIKDRRYTVDKYQLHLSIMCNYSKPKSPVKFNDTVCAYLKNNPDVKIIGIDRGERHLLYVSMIDRDGKVVKDKNGNYIQYSLNTITGAYKDRDGNPVEFETPYRELLDKKEKEREDARESWETVENIKELKSGYMSQVVHHIAKLMVEYNAIVVLEDLNGGFKNGRKKVEKQVYQNFEKALIEKLNYLVFKDVPSDEPGGLYKALQLTDKFESFKKLTKQSGFLFYVPAWNTSKIDPMTGFVDLLKPPSDMSMKAIRYNAAAKDFFGKFDAIRYNAEKDYFEFSFDYRNFTEKAGDSRTNWTVCTYGDLRYAFNRELNNGKGGYEKWNVTERMKELLNENGIDYKGGDLKSAITSRNSAKLYAPLAKLLRVTLAMRYSSTEDKRDFILSPVADENGEFYCSEGRCDGLPQDADANGAFNIARKGLWVLEQIDQAEKYSDWTTKVSNVEWLRYVQTRFR